MDRRPYDPERDRAGLWRLKRAFELELAGASGGDGKRARYAGKLTDAYRERYLDWVERCVDESPDCVTVAAADGGSVDEQRESDGGEPGRPSSGVPSDGGEPSEANRASSDRMSDGGELAGYVFVLPESLALIWDAAVVNELYVEPARRGTGLADDLFEAALEAASGQDLPLDRVALDVAPSNERARAFYERHRFEPWGELVAREL